jgi:hypothetical protein
MTLVSLASCVHVTEVRGPDGEPAHLIDCSATRDCYDKATSLCPAGYELRSTAARVGGSEGSLVTEILVSCKVDIPEPEVFAAPVAPQPEVPRVCEAASTHLPAFAHYWASHAKGAEPLDDLPRPQDFVTVCHAMPENVQLCMNAVYRSAHVDRCDAVLLRLDAPAKDKVDGLFLKAPAAATSDSSGR